MAEIKIRKLISLPVSKSVADSAVWGLQGAEAVLIVRMQPKSQQGSSKNQWLIYHRQDMEWQAKTPDWMKPLIEQGELVGEERNVTRLFPGKQFQSLQEIKLALEIASEAN